MSIQTQQSLSGFIATEPKLTRTERGDAKFYARIGKPHHTRQPDGSFTRDPTTFHDLVIFHRAAERAYERFTKGDTFIAEGYVSTHTRTDPDRQTVQAEEFVARKIGHDTARTNYTINRTNPAHATSIGQTTRPTEPAPTAPTTTTVPFGL